MIEVVHSIFRRRFSKEESLSALYNYAYGSSCDLNYRLRQGSSRKHNIIADKMSQLESEQELPILYRATLWEHFIKDFGVNKDELIGKTITDKGFMSTSIDSEVPKELYPIDSGTLFMRIRSKGKHRAIDVNATLGKMSPYPYQKEILLGRRTQFTVVDLTNEKGITYIEVELKS